MKKITFFLVALFCIVTGFSQNQSFTINGKVVDNKSNEPLPGASVIIKGTSNGVSTDVNGSFSIKSSQDLNVLEISFIGYASQEVELHRDPEQTCRSGPSLDRRSVRSTSA